MANDDEQTDGECLTAFLDRHDETAFASLVERHARLVMNVCRRLLGPGPDAEDAAQAVFLTLSKKAGSLRRTGSIAPWLHHVAYQIAVNAIRAKQARSERERKIAETSRPTMPHEPTDASEIQATLMAALDALPTKYRQALILFHMESRSMDQVAAAVGCSLNAVGLRLSRGRALLRQRLIRCGVALSIPTLVTLLSTDSGAVILPVGYATAIAKAATLFAAGQTVATGLASTQAIALTKGALKIMAYSQLKTVAAIALIGIGAATFGSLALMSATQNKTSGTSSTGVHTTPDTIPSHAAGKRHSQLPSVTLTESVHPRPGPLPPNTPTVSTDTNRYCRIHGKVVNAFDDSPIAGAHVRLRGPLLTTWTHPPMLSAQTQSDGSFAFDRVAMARFDYLDAWADGFGSKFLPIGGSQFSPHEGDNEWLIALAPAWGNIQGRVLDRVTGQPVPQATISCLPFMAPNLESYRSYISAQSDGTFSLPFAFDHDEMQDESQVPFLLMAKAPGYKTSLLGEDGTLTMMRRQAINDLCIALTPEDRTPPDTVQTEGYLHGLVQYEDGAPATNLSVSILTPNPHNATWLDSTNLDPTGTFQFQLTNGVYKLKVNPVFSFTYKIENATSLNSPHSERLFPLCEIKGMESLVTVKAGEITPILLTVSRPASLHISFVDTIGQPYLAGGKIALVNKTRNGSKQTTMTLEEGLSTFDLIDLKSDTYFLHMAGNDGCSADPCQVDLVSGTYQEVIITLKSSPIVIRGKITDSQTGMPVSNAVIRFTHRGNDRQVMYFHPEKTDATGEFSQSLPDRDEYSLNYSVEQPYYVSEQGCLAVKSGIPLSPLNIRMEKGARLEIQLVGLERLPNESDVIIGLAIGYRGQTVHLHTVKMARSGWIKQQGLQKYEQGFKAGRVEVEVRSYPDFDVTAGILIGKQSIDLRAGEIRRIEIPVSDPP